jgi:hypothetical protein
MSDASGPISGLPLPPKTSALSIWSLVLGILSLCCCGFLTAIPGVICGHMALSRIRRSGGSLGGQGLAIAGLVTGYVGMVLVTLILPSMLLPALARAKEKAQTITCMNHLREIDQAKKQWANDHQKQATDIPVESDLAPYLGSSAGQIMKCPAGGEYQINAVGEHATCSIPKHNLK